MQKIEIIVSKPQCMAGVDFTEDEEEIRKAQEEGHTPVVISYLHGKLEREMGYDIGLALNGEVLEGEGEYEVEVKGYPGKCKAFLWNDSLGRPRGLIVDVDDKEGLESAMKKYTEKCDIL